MSLVTDSPKTPENYLDGADLEPILESAPAPAPAAATAPEAAPQAMAPRMFPGGGGDNFFLRAAQADKAYTKFFFGFLLMTIGCLMPWAAESELGGYKLGYYTPIGALILVVGLYGMWRLWLAMVTNKFTLGPVGLNFLVFFWGLFQILALNSEWKHVLDPEVAAREAKAAGKPTENVEKGMFPSLAGAFSDDHDLYTVQHNLNGFGPGRVITAFGSIYVVWVFLGSIFGVMSKKKGPAPAGGPSRGGQPSGGRRPAGGAGAGAGGARAPRTPAEAAPGAASAAPAAPTSGEAPKL
ncbi:MAG: hypothetical protein JNM84_03925 [Planctomycetes bacterium]|nr:hypothetical protein [Planctomycetota bacterium]